MFVASIVKIKTINKDVLDSRVDTDKLCTQVGLHLSTDKNLCIAELSMGWVDPRVGLGREWVENLCC